MKKKTIIILFSVAVAVVAIASIAVDFYIRDSESFYPEHFKVGSFVAINNSGRYYWYDDENQCFTGEYTEVSFKAKGIIGTEYHSDKRYRVYGEIIYDGKALMAEYDYVRLGYWGSNEYGAITYDMNITDTHLDGTGTDFIANQCVLVFEDSFTKPIIIFTNFAGEESRKGYYGESLEEAEANKQEYNGNIKKAE